MHIGHDFPLCPPSARISTHCGLLAACQPANTALAKAARDPLGAESDGVSLPLAFWAFPAALGTLVPPSSRTCPLSCFHDSTLSQLLTRLRPLSCGHLGTLSSSCPLKVGVQVPSLSHCPFDGDTLPRECPHLATSMLTTPKL